MTVSISLMGYRRRFGSRLLKSGESVGSGLVLNSGRVLSVRVATSSISGKGLRVVVTGGHGDGEGIGKDIVFSERRG